MSKKDKCSVPLQSTASSLLTKHKPFYITLFVKVLKPLNHKAHQRPHTVHFTEERTNNNNKRSLNSNSSGATKQE